MLVGIVRVKFVAIFIGPVGIGLLETYKAIIQLIGTIAGMGIQSSAVRDVAEAVGADDQIRIGRTILTLRRICWLTGGIGTLLVLLLSRQLSQITFGTIKYAVSIAMIGFIVLFTNIQGGQIALIQGMRRIGDLARLNILGSVAGSVVTVLLYAWLGIQGIVPALLALSVIQLGASWWFARRVQVPTVTMSWWESIRFAGGMVKLGLSFMWSGLLVAAVAYATRILITHEIDLVAVGVYTAAFSLSGMIVNFILGAMGADYYPSLTAISSDHIQMCNLVNEQTEVGLLMALPGLLATLSFAPWFIKIFYTSEFGSAAILLQWFVLGCLGRVISWPMGFVMLAKGKAKLFALVQTLANFLHIFFVWLLLLLIGIEGVAIAFALLYVISTFVVFFVSRYLIGFKWSSGVWKLLWVFLPVVACSFLANRFLSVTAATIIGSILTFIMSIYCLIGLSERLGPDHKICRVVKKIPLMNGILCFKAE